MFENVLHQSAVEQLKQSIENKTLAPALLFYGPPSSAKLTTALELARVISCKADTQGDWLCECQSCIQHKLLVHQNLLLLGPRDMGLEIAASRASYLDALAQNADYKEATKYLFLRSFRKQLLRYHPVLLEEDANAAKIAPIVSEINELLEEIETITEHNSSGQNTILDIDTQQMDAKQLERIKKISDDLVKLSTDLETKYAYDTIPVAQIRNLSFWARHTTSDGRKIIIIENADRMLDASKNALLKILEEPPQKVLFVLLTANKNALLPTILSRLRPYRFFERKETEQRKVVERVFHGDAHNIESFLLTYLPIPLGTIQANAVQLYEAMQNKDPGDLDMIIKNLDGFKSRLVQSLFFNQLFLLERETIHKTSSEKKALVLEQSYERLSLIKACYENIRLLNQSPQSAFESLVNSTSKSFSV